MVLKLNGITIPETASGARDVKFNGVSINQLQFNGVTVWTRGGGSDIVYESRVATTNPVTITFPWIGTYRCIVVGAGGGGAAWMHRSISGLPEYVAASVPGGSGGYIQADLTTTTIGKTARVYVGAAGTSYYRAEPSAKTSASPWTVTGGTGDNSYISILNGSSFYYCLRAYGGVGGSVHAVIEQSVVGGYDSNFTFTRGDGGGWYTNPVSGVTISNRTTAIGNTGTENHSGMLSTNIPQTFTATAQPVYSPFSSVDTAGRGAGYSCYVKATDGAWEATSGDPYRSYDGYVKITYLGEI